MALRDGELGRRTGVSVRTLHYYKGIERSLAKMYADRPPEIERHGDAIPDPELMRYISLAMK